MPPRSGHRGAASRGAFALAVLASLVVLFTPGDDELAALPGVDKVVHLVLFAVLAVTGRWTGVPARPLVLLLTAYAALSEVLQAVLPLDRSGNLADLLADLAGVVIGLITWAVLRREAAPGSLGR